MKKFMTGLLVVLIIAGVFIASVGLEVGGYKLGGFLGVQRAKMVGTINTEVVKQEDKVFKNSTQYQDNIINELAEVKLEMMKTDSDVIKKALAEDVLSRFSDFDAYNIENDALRNWFLDILEGSY